MLLVRSLFLSLLLHTETKNYILGYNILAVNTLLSPSHHLFHDVILLQLANRGHNVTLLGHDKDKHGHPNYTHIIMEGVYEKMKENLSDLLQLQYLSNWEMIQVFLWYTDFTCRLDQQTEGLKAITEYPDDFKFDLIIWDITSGQCLYPLIEKFGHPPVIAVNPFINQPNIFKNVWQSYIPFMLHPYTDSMTFLQRVQSNINALILELARKFYYIPQQEILAEKYFGKINVTLEESERNMSLMLANYNPVFNYVEALPPNIIPVGGLHIQPKPLPEDLKKILDNSESGAILFSLGSNVRSKELGKEKILSITKCFKKIKQTVIWKFENDSLENLPKNVFIRQWVPQNDVLGHSNTVLFITHGGLLSSHEAVYNGVPVIGIPFFLDQILNVQNFISKGIGERLGFNEITEDTLCNTIKKILNNKSYKDKAKKLSVLYKDTQNKPLDTAIYWIEYILKHKTADHLNLATRKMNFLELFNLDLILICLLLVMFTLFTSCCIVYFCIVKCVKKRISQKIKTS